MIAFLSGTMAAVTADRALIDVGGVGYAVLMPQSALGKLPPAGQPVVVHTALQVSDKGAFLFGFLSEEEKALFERLVSVSGIGPKMALAALSAFTPQALASAIANEDKALVAQIPGVGKKTASRMILELKGSLEQGLGGLFAPAAGEGDVGAPEQPAALQGATEALLSMGFTSAEAELALKGAPEGAAEPQLLQHALKRLGSR